MDQTELDFVKEQGDLNLRVLALENSLKWLLQFSADQTFESSDVIACADKFYNFIKSGTVS